MSKDKNELCRRCRKFYNSAGSDYCSNCLATHATWAPRLGCGDVGCYRSHEEPIRDTAATGRDNGGPMTEQKACITCGKEFVTDYPDEECDTCFTAPFPPRESGKVVKIEEKEGG